MALGALRVHDLRVGNNQPWNWKREGVALGVDTLTLVVLGILATLVATGLIYTHFSSIVHNPLFWALVGGGVAILTWNMVAHLIQRQRPHQVSPIPPTTQQAASTAHTSIPTTTIDTSTLSLMTSGAGVQKIVIPHLVGTHQRPGYLLSLRKLLPFALEITIEGDWNEHEFAEVKTLFRTAIWSISSHGEIISYPLLPNTHILKTKFGYGEPSIFSFHKAVVLTSTSRLPLRTLHNEKAKISFAACPAKLYKNDPSHWSLTHTDSGDWFQSDQKVHGQQSPSICDLPLDVIRKLFGELPFKSQVRLASSCTYFTQITNSSSQWYQQVYLPPRTLLKNLTTHESQHPWFKRWAQVCAEAGSPCLYSSNSTDAPTIWDVQDWLPTIWPQGEVCVCGTIQGAYFYSIGLNIEVKNGTKWGALTAFSLIDRGMYSDLCYLFFPNPCVEAGDVEKNSVRSMPTEWPKDNATLSLHALAENSFKVFSEIKGFRKEVSYYKFTIAPPQ